MKNTKSFTTLIISIFLLLCCSKEVDYVWIYFDETQCANPWVKGNNEFETKNNITEFFILKNIKISSIEISNQSSPEICLACLCKTGKRIKIKIYTSDLRKSIEEGFKELKD